MGEKALIQICERTWSQRLTPCYLFAVSKGFGGRLNFQREKERPQGSRALVSLFEGGGTAAGSARGGAEARPLPFTLPRTLVLPSPRGPRAGAETLPPRHEPPRAPLATVTHSLAPHLSEGKESGLGAAYNLPQTPAFSTRVTA